MKLRAHYVKIWPGRWAAVLCVLALAACNGTLQVGVEGRPGPHQGTLGAAVGETPQLGKHETPAAREESGSAQWPTSRMATSGCWVWISGDTVYLPSEGGERRVARLPAGAGRRTLSGRYLAYVSDGELRVLDLADGSSRALHEFDDRPAQDYALRWSSDGSTLAYARAWDGEDGARMVELGLTDGYEQRLIDTLLARPAGPTPTPPAMPPVPPEPGFANLHILGCERSRGYLAVTPAGGQARYAAVWLYDLARKARVRELALPQAESIVTLAASPDLAWLAVARSDSERTRIELYPLLEARAAQDSPATKAPRLLRELPSAHVTELHWSADGHAIAYLRLEGMPGLAVSPGLGLEVARVEAGAVLTVPISVSPEARLHGWTADGLAVLLEALDGISRQRVVSLVDVATGRATSLPLPEGASVLGWIGEAPVEGEE